MGLIAESSDGRLTEQAPEQATSFPSDGGEGWGVDTRLQYHVLLKYITVAAPFQEELVL